MLLAASIIALFIGPVLFQLARIGPRVLAFLQGFSFITIAGLLMFSILPNAIRGGGLFAWVFVALGLAFPIVLEKMFHRVAQELHMFVLLLGVLGLFFHTLVDGVALALPDAGELLHADGGHEGENLALAVVLHRFPVGVAVWYVIGPAFSAVAAIGILILMAAGTVVGFQWGANLLPFLQGPDIALFQAFVAGSILHVIVYEPGHHDHGLAQVGNTSRWPDRIGLLFGLALLFVYL